MTVNGTNYRLTKHGRKRYIERIGFASDAEMIKTAVLGLPNTRFIWKNAPHKGFRLVTVLRDDYVAR